MPFVANVIKITDSRIRDILTEISKKSTLAYSTVIRAKLILLADQGNSNALIVKELGLCRNTVSKWRNRFFQCLPLLEKVSQEVPDKLYGVIEDFLKDIQRSGAPRDYTMEQNMKIREIACCSPKDCGVERSHWSSVALARYVNSQGITTSVSPKTVWRYLKEGDIKPHLSRYWLHSPEKVDSPVTYAEKINEICAIYRDAGELAKSLTAIPHQSEDSVDCTHQQDDFSEITAPDESCTASREVTEHIVSLDEMTGIQALGRKYKDKPVAPGMPFSREFEYIRNGTTSLIGFFDVVTGKVICPYFNSTRTESDLVNAVDNVVRTDPLASWTFVCDNLNTHMSESLVRFVASQLGTPDEELGVKGKSGILKTMESRAQYLHDKEHRIRFVYTPKHCSWMNQIEIWFGIINRQLLRRSCYDSVDELIQSMLRFIEQYNITAKPFKWTYLGVALAI